MKPEAPSLKQLQNDFWKMIRVADAKNNFKSYLAEKSRSENRHEIYKKTVKYAHISALRTRFPCVKKLLGDVYTGIANYYYLNESAYSQDLNEYGDNFSEYLKLYPDARQIKGLITLAACELSIEKTYYAENQPQFDMSMVEKWIEAQQSQESIKTFLEFQDTLSSFFINSDHVALLAEEHPYLSVDSLKGGWYTIYRLNNKVCLSLCERNEALAVKALIRGMSLEALGNRIPQLNTWIPIWIQRTWLTNLTVSY